MKSLKIITGRDRELLQALALKVRLVSLRQIADHWFGGDVANARRRLRQLVAAGLLQRVNVTARPTPLLVGPVVVWQPGQLAPDFGKVARLIETRWHHRPVRHCATFIATTKTANAFGGKARGELKRPLQATHDLGVAAVWLRLHREQSDLAAAWRSEDLLAHTRRGHGDKFPDAFVVNTADEIVAVIEFSGGYDTDRVREFHADCESRRLPYQLW